MRVLFYLCWTRKRSFFTEKEILSSQSPINVTRFFHLKRSVSIQDKTWHYLLNCQCRNKSNTHTIIVPSVHWCHFLWKTTQTRKQDIKYKLSKIRHDWTETESVIEFVVLLCASSCRLIRCIHETYLRTTRMWRINLCYTMTLYGRMYKGWDMKPFEMSFIFLSLIFISSFNSMMYRTVHSYVLYDVLFLSDTWKDRWTDRCSSSI